MDELGPRFWLWVVGVALAIGVGGILLFTLVGAVWYAWGFFGAIIFFGLLLIVAGWFYDRAHARPGDDLDTSA
jgi:hypothetical protein